MGFHSHGGTKMNGLSGKIPKMDGTPTAGWFIGKNPISKWMMTGGTPFLGNLHMIDTGILGNIY